jgi:hypothetical protein
MIKITKTNSKETKNLTVTEINKFTAKLIILKIKFQQNQFNFNKIKWSDNQSTRTMT